MPRNQREGKGSKPKPNANPRQQKGPFRPVFETLGVVSLAFGGMCTGSSHNIISFWLYALGITSVGFGIRPLPKWIAFGVSLLSALVAGLLTFEILWSTRSVRPMPSPSPSPVVRQERPYVWVKAIEAFLDNPEQLARGVVIEMIFENAGNVAAFNATAVSHLVVMKSKARDKPPPPSLSIGKSTPEFLPPKGVVRQLLPKVDGMPFDESLIPLIERKEAFLYVFGELTYKDENQTIYTGHYCFLYEPKRKDFEITPFYND